MSSRFTKYIAYTWQEAESIVKTLVVAVAPHGNVVGGPNDISTWWHYGKGSLMVFGNGRVAFVKKENFKDLRWQP